MSLDLSTNRAAYVVLARIYVAYPAVYHAVATETVAVGTDVYEGRVLDVNRIRESFPGVRQTGMPLPDAVLELANPDRRFDASLEEHNYWAHRIAELYCWERGTELDPASDLIFRGFVQFPDGIEMTPTSVIVRLSDFREPWNVKVPKNQLDSARYPHASSFAEGRPIPLLYGDFTTELSGLAYGVEAFCVDTGLRGGGAVDPVLKVCDPTGTAIGAIGGTITISRGASNVTTASAIGIDLDGTGPRHDAGTLVLDRSTWSSPDGDYAYQEGDRFYVQAKGNRNGTGALIQTPAEVMRDLLLATTSATAADIDVASYFLAYSYFEALGPYFRVRRHLVETQDLWDVIAQIGFEAGIDVSNRGGKVVFQVWQPFLASAPDAPVDIDENAIVDGSFHVLVDPESVYANRVLAKYNWSPDAEKYLLRHAAEFEGLTVDDVTQEYAFDWMYFLKSVRQRVRRLSWLSSQALRVYRFDVGFRALTCHLGERKRLTYAPLGIVDRDVQIRALDKDLARGVVRVTAWDAYLRSDIGRWSPAGTPAYRGATEDQRKRWGFWTDASGLADPDDPASGRSKWI